MDDEKLDAMKNALSEIDRAAAFMLVSVRENPDNPEASAETCSVLYCPEEYLGQLLTHMNPAEVIGIPLSQVKAHLDLYQQVLTRRTILDKRTGEVLKDEIIERPAKDWSMLN